MSNENKVSVAWVEETIESWLVESDMAQTASGDDAGEYEGKLAALLRDHLTAMRLLRGELGWAKKLRGVADVLKDRELSYAVAGRVRKLDAFLAASVLEGEELDV